MIFYTKKMFNFSFGHMMMEILLITNETVQNKYLKSQAHSLKSNTLTSYGVTDQDNGLGFLSATLFYEKPSRL